MADDTHATASTDSPAGENTDSHAAGTAEGTTSHDIPWPDHLKAAIGEGWDPAPAMPHPAHASVAPHTAKRRDALSALFAGRTIVIPSGSLKSRANDTDYAFRAASAFTWLTGETASDAVLVLTPSATTHQATLYVREYAQPGEVEYFTSRLHGAVWVGNVPSVSDTADVLGIATRPLGALADDLSGQRDDAVVMLRGVDPTVDALFARGEDAGLVEAVDELRLIKDDWELDRLRHACEITARGFGDVARELPRVVGRGDVRGERWLEGTFWRRARLEGNDVGYTSILGTGAHATHLHWWRNHGIVEAGSLLLADMGVETDELYTADITRTMPVDGVWTPSQLKVYRAVQEAQTAGISEVRAGNDFLAAHNAAMYVLADHLHSWGILPVTAAESCAEDPESPGAGLHRRYTLHGTSHMLGIDVHDCAAAREETYKGGTLAAGHVLTVEPGLYFQLNDRTVPQELRGIGVRIEDDIVVTDGDPITLSAMLPRDPDEIVQWLADSRSGDGAP